MGGGRDKRAVCVGERERVGENRFDKMILFLLLSDLLVLVGQLC